MTANALYPGSATWLILKISASSSSSLALSLYACGALRYGGSGLPFVTEAERRARMEVTSWEVGVTEVTRRAKSSIQEAFVSEGSWTKLLEA